MTRTLAEFSAKFHEALVSARAASGFEPDIPSDAVIELHLRGKHELSEEAATAALFIDSSKFYRNIDVSIHPKLIDGSHFFVAASGHEPATWAETRHPESSGPFNILSPL